MSPAVLTTRRVTLRCTQPTEHRIAVDNACRQNSRSPFEDPETGVHTQRCTAKALQLAARTVLQSPGYNRIVPALVRTRPLGNMGMYVRTFVRVHGWM